MRVNNKDGFKTQVLQLVDAILVVVAFWLGIMIWNTLGITLARNTALIKVDGASIEGLWHIFPVLFIAVPFIPLSLEITGFYQRYGRQKPLRALSRCVQGHLVVLIAFALLSVLLKITPHRPSMVLGFVFSTSLIWGREMLARRRVKERAHKGKGRIRLLLAGIPETTQAWWDGLDEEVKEQYVILGQYDFEEDGSSQLCQLLSDTAAERVVFIAAELEFNKVAYAIEECEIQGVEVWLASNIVRARICQPGFDLLGGTPMLVLRSTPSLSWALLLKEAIDRVGAAVLICLTSPLWLAAYIGTKIQSPGPVFYRQERAGRYGNPFHMVKFRSMIMDADKKLEELKQQQGNQMSGPVFKLDHDPRIFAWGRIMRKFSIDELPQLINVFKGEMSLVGPRPMAMYELPDIEKSEHRRKLSVKPGITCIWQVEGRNTITDFHDWVQLDLKYIDNWSLWLDMIILLKTVPAVLFSRGAK